MRKITVTFTVEDEDYPKAMELVAASLFSGKPWIPGFLFQSYFTGFALHFDRDSKSPQTRVFRSEEEALDFKYGQGGSTQ